MSQMSRRRSFYSDPFLFMTGSASQKSQRYPIAGAGLGFRYELVDQMQGHSLSQVNFMEVAPENWIRVGGKRGRILREYTERFPFVCHGLSLSIGGPAPIDDSFLVELKAFLEQHDIRAYTEHLSYCGDSGQLYDLMPIPFTTEAVDYVAGRIRHVQDVLERRIGNAERLMDRLEDVVTFQRTRDPEVRSNYMLVTALMPEMHKVARRLLEPPYRTFVMPGAAYDLPDHIRVGVGGGAAAQPAVMASGAAPR